MIDSPSSHMAAAAFATARFAAAFIVWLTEKGRPANPVDVGGCKDSAPPRTRFNLPVLCK